MLDGTVVARGEEHAAAGGAGSQRRSARTGPAERARSAGCRSDLQVADLLWLDGHSTRRPALPRPPRRCSRGSASPPRRSWTTSPLPVVGAGRRCCASPRRRASRRCTPGTWASRYRPGGGPRCGCGCRCRGSGRCVVGRVDAGRPARPDRIAQPAARRAGRARAALRGPGRGERGGAPAGGGLRQLRRAESPFWTACPPTSPATRSGSTRGWWGWSSSPGSRPTAGCGCRTGGAPPAAGSAAIPWARRADPPADAVAGRPGFARRGWRDGHGLAAARRRADRRRPGASAGRAAAAGRRARRRRDRAGRRAVEARCGSSRDDAGRRGDTIAAAAHRRVGRRAGARRPRLADGVTRAPPPLGAAAGARRDRRAPRAQPRADAALRPPRRVALGPPTGPGTPLPRPGAGRRTRRGPPLAATDRRRRPTAAAGRPPTSRAGAGRAAEPVEARRLEQHFVYNSLNTIAVADPHRPRPGPGAAVRVRRPVPGRRPARRHRSTLGARARRRARLPRSWSRPGSARGCGSRSTSTRALHGRPGRARCACSPPCATPCSATSSRCPRAACSP